MDARNKLINELTERIRQNQVGIKAQELFLGKYLASLKAELFQNSAQEKAFKRAQELKEQLPFNQKVVGKIVKLVERNEEIKNLLKENREGISEIEKKNEDIFEEIGRAACMAYKNFPEQKKQFEDIFTRLHELEIDLKSIDSKLKGSDSSDTGRSILNKIKEKSRLVYFRGIRAARSKKLRRAYRQAGYDICNSEISKQIDDKAFLFIFDSYNKNKAQIQNIDKQSDSFQKEQESLWEKLKDLGAEKNYQKRVNELKKEIKQIEMQMEVAYGNLGYLYCIHPVKSLSEDTDIAKHLKQMKQLEKKNEKYENQIQRLEAAIHIDSLSEQIALKQKRIENLKKEIDTYNEEIASLKEQITYNESEKEKLINVRGPERSLMILNYGPKI